MNLDETYDCLVLDDGTKYTVTLSGRKYSNPRICWSVWVTRVNPNGGAAKCWEAEWLANEDTARKRANAYWTAIRNGSRP